MSPIIVVGLTFDLHRGDSEIIAAPAIISMWRAAERVRAELSRRQPVMSVRAAQMMTIIDLWRHTASCSRSYGSHLFLAPMLCYRFYFTSRARKQQRRTILGVATARASFAVPLYACASPSVDIAMDIFVEALIIVGFIFTGSSRQQMFDFA